MDLTQQLNSISSRQDLTAFIQSLISDYKSDSENWENNNLVAYLDALAGWTEDMDGYFQNIGEEVPEQPSWSLFGKMLLAAKYYE
jgi:hypothetical protein